MSSLVENVQWQADFDFDAFEWDEWVRQLGDVMPMAVYDLPRILDSAAAWDIMYHARHWPEDRAYELGYVRVPPGLRNMLAHVGVIAAHQQHYAARALYRHCTQYVTGSGVVRAVPIDHMDSIPVVPDHLIRSICTLAHLRENYRLVKCWMENVIKHGSSRSTTLSSAPLPGRQAAGRRRRRTCSLDTAVHPEVVQAAVNKALAAISDIAPSQLPSMWCTVSPSSTARLTIALYARQRALCDV